MTQALAPVQLSAARARQVGSPWRAAFPALAATHEGRVVYLDNAAMTLRPRPVIDAFADAYLRLPANVHRGQYALAEATTAAFEGARARVARFINALKHEIVVTKNCTESINLVAHGLGLPPNAEVLVPVLEHHSNYLPWRRVARVRPIGLTPAGQIDLEQLEGAIGPQTAAIAFTYVSNVTGVIQPVREIVALAKKHGLVTILDAAQAVAHLPVDVEALGCDFVAFSGYKMFGPAGVGILWGRDERLRELGVWSVGGGTVSHVGDDVSYYPDGRRFEAGTPNIEGLVGLAAAVRWLEESDRDAMHRHTDGLAERFRQHLDRLGDAFDATLRFDSPSTPIVTIAIKAGGMSSARLAAMLSDAHGIAVRDGVHCCQPLFTYLGVRESIRVSFQCYNTEDEVDRLANALEELRPLMAG